MEINKQNLHKLATAKCTTQDQEIIRLASVAVKNLLPSLLKEAENGKLCYLLKPYQIPALTNFVAANTTLYCKILKEIGKILENQPYNFSIHLEHSYLGGNKEYLLNTELIISWEN